MHSKQLCKHGKGWVFGKQGDNYKYRQHWHLQPAQRGTFGACQDGPSQKRKAGRPSLALAPTFSVVYLYIIWYLQYTQCT